MRRSWTRWRLKRLQRQVERQLHQVEMLRQLTEYKRLQASRLEELLHPLLVVSLPPEEAAAQFPPREIPSPAPRPLGVSPLEMAQAHPELQLEPKPEPLAPETAQAIDRLLGLGQPQS